MITFEQFTNDLQPIELGILENLKEICFNLKPQRILEIGSGWGMSTRAFLQYAPAAHIITIDKLDRNLPSRKGYPERVAGFEDRLEEKIGDSRQIVPQLEGTFDLIYIDGSHVYEEVLADLRNSLTKTHPGSTIIMDDCLHQKHENMEYGVWFALRQVLWENRDKQWNVGISLAGHGQAVLNI